MLIQKPGKSKEQLLSCLANLKDEFKAQIAENDIVITDIMDGYLIQAQRKVFILTFWIKAKIVAGHGVFELTWETNAPENRVRESLDKVIKVLEKC